MGKTSIHWTDETWNPAVGCKRVSAGCDHCYAFHLHDQRHVAWKRGRMPSAPAQYHKPFSQVQLMPDRLELPLKWRKPRRVFVNSMSDAWHDDIPTAFIARIFTVMAATPQHTYQILTKRPQRMLDTLTNGDFFDAIATRLANLADFDGRCATNTIDTWPLPNVWLGVSTENQQTADERIPLLLKTPAAVRFLSAEPLLGPIDITHWLTFEGEYEKAEWCLAHYGHSQPLHWVIVGGESGPHARPMNPDWARNIRDACNKASVAFFYKQGSARRSGQDRELDGRLWEEYPEVN